MKEKPCPKTMSGKHIWIDKPEFFPEEYFPQRHLRDISECTLCGIINDLKKK